jgi:hypothetical protein
VNDRNPRQILAPNAGDLGAWVTGWCFCSTRLGFLRLELAAARVERSKQAVRGFRLALPRLDRSQAAGEMVPALRQSRVVSGTRCHRWAGGSAENRSRSSPPARLVIKEALPGVAAKRRRPAERRPGERGLPLVFERAWRKGKDFLSRVSRVKPGEWAGPAVGSFTRETWASCMTRGREFHA